jgi:hypothetical protein
MARATPKNAAALRGWSTIPGVARPRRASYGLAAERHPIDKDSA